MTPEELYQDLLRRQVKLSINGDMLSFTAPESGLTPELIGAMKRHKRWLLERVRLDSSDQAVDDTVYAASHGQEALWLLHRENPQSASYNTAAALRILSPINLVALERSVLKLMLRHDALRMTFRTVAGQLKAVVGKAPHVDFQQIDASIWDETQLREAVQAEYARPFDLTDGPLLRVRLFSQADDRHILLMTLHHIVFDAASLWILQTEMQQLYRSEVSGEACLQPVLPANYGDFLKWQRELPDSPRGAEQWKYWQQELQGEPAPGELPWSYPRPRHGQRSGATLHFKIDAELTSGIRQLAKHVGATPFVTTLALFEALLHRHSGQRDFIVGTTTSGRSQRQFASCIGYFVNVLPIRCHVAEKVSFLEFVQQTKQRAVAALTHSEFPFSVLVDRLKPVRELNAPPLCRVMFGLQKPHALAEVAQLLEGCGEPIEWGGMCAASYEMNQQEGQFDLTMELYEAHSTFCGVLKYDRNLMSDSAATSFAERFVEFTRGVVKNSELLIDDYQITTPAERETLLAWSTGDVLLEPKYLRYDQCFEATVAAHPSESAISFGEETLDYRTLNARANSLARVLREYGVSPGGTVACSARRQLDCPVLLLATMKCGAAFVPIAPDSPPQRLAKIVEECRPDLLVTSGPLLSDAIEPLLQTRTATINELVELSKPRDTSNLAIDFSNQTIAYIIYTSGSNGIPKGVKVSHHAICRHVVSMRQVYGISSTDRVLQFCEWTFDPAMEQMLVPWSTGALVVMRGESMYTSESFWRQVSLRQLTVVNVPPSFLVECSANIPEAKSLRLLIVGGDVFPTQVLPAWHRTGVRILNAYGPTEAVITATTHDVNPKVVGHRVPIGRPKPGSRALVLGSKNQLVPIGVPGELCLGGSMLASGYVENSMARQTSFCDLDCNELPAEPIYRTGDLVRWNDIGDLEFLGRIDRQIKIRGFRVELGEVENALRDIPQVRQAFVQLREESNHAYLAAYVATMGESPPTKDDILHQLKSSLPIYMLPERLGIVDHLPINSSGKVDAAKLPELPRPSPRGSQRYVPPRTPLETAMAQTWQEVLEVESVGIHDDFYQLGGGSLQALRIVSRLTELKVMPKDESTELSPHMLFQYVTIAELSTLLRLESTIDPVGAPLPKDVTQSSFVTR